MSRRRAAISAFVLASGLYTPAAAQGHREPAEAGIVTSDIAHFWDAFDARARLGTVKAIDSLYFRRGSPGLEDWIKVRLHNAGDLAKAVDAAADYYTTARPLTLDIARIEPQLRSHFVRFHQLYPDARFPDVYFLIGRLSTGGTTSGRALLIGAEMYGRTPGAPVEKLNPWLQQVLTGPDGLPTVVMHELVHFQQRNASNTLLAHSLREGSADFVAELVTGENINRRIHEWVAADSTREGALWREFRTRMSRSDLSGWFTSDDVTKRPKDLGYFIGYRIAQAYYEQAADKAAAIRQIITTRDANKLLAQSGYGARWP